MVKQLLQREDDWHNILLFFHGIMESLESLGPLLGVEIMALRAKIIVVLRAKIIVSADC